MPLSCIVGAVDSLLCISVCGVHDLLNIVVETPIKFVIHYLKKHQIRNCVRDQLITNRGLSNELQRQSIL